MIIVGYDDWEERERERERERPFENEFLGSWCISRVIILNIKLCNCQETGSRCHQQIYESSSFAVLK